MENKTKILYVDDEEINTQVFEITFSHKFEVLIAESSETGLKLIQNNPDIKFVVSDMKMPKMNGMEFIWEIKKTNKELPCMLLSGYQQTQEIFDAIKNNIIVAYQLKPFNRSEIEKLIEEHT